MSSEYADDVDSMLTTSDDTYDPSISSESSLEQVISSSTTPFVSSSDDDGQSDVSTTNSRTSEVLPVLASTPLESVHNSINNNLNAQDNVPDQINEVPVELIPAPSPNSIELIESSENTPVKKRKRSIGTPKCNVSILDDDDDGSTCPICLDHWQMSGPHRLIALKCGHLFGDSCLRRWLKECPSNAKVCPSCKSKTFARDIRYLYAKRIRAIDNTEETRLREELERHKESYSRMQTDYELMAFELKTVRAQVTRLESDIERMRRIQNSNSFDVDSTIMEKSKDYKFDHKMFLSKNIPISQEAGCRVLAYSNCRTNLMISQKSSQSLFPGYGLKFIDVKENFRPTTFLHISIKCVRDLSLNTNEDLVLCASMDRTAKIFDIHNLINTQTFSPSDKGIWTCAFDRSHRPNSVYLGAQNGSTYIFDIRNPNAIVEEAHVMGDLSPVISICPIPTTDIFPLGGFLVCKLQSLWFYEFLSSQKLNATRLSVDGPFLSINYDAGTGNVLISTRNSDKFPLSKYILGKIEKLNNIVVLETQMSLFGSKVTPVMSRCTQIPVAENNSLICAYIQDVKQLALWNVGESIKVQSLPCADIIYDTCPITINGKKFMAASTDSKCRIYEINSILKNRT